MITAAMSRVKRKSVISWSTWIIRTRSLWRFCNAWRHNTRRYCSILVGLIPNWLADWESTSSKLVRKLLRGRREGWEKIVILVETLSPQASGQLKAISVTDEFELLSPLSALSATQVAVLPLMARKRAAFSTSCPILTYPVL